MLRPIAIAGNERYRNDPTVDDFYKNVIDLRRSVKKQLKERTAEGADEVKRIDSEQLTLKILANATSYGVFIELNVEDSDETESGKAERIFRRGCGHRQSGMHTRARRCLRRRRA